MKPTDVFAEAGTEVFSAWGPRFVPDSPASGISQLAWLIELIIPPSPETSQFEN
jgi:hypothetical protein